MKSRTTPPRLSLFVAAIAVIAFARPASFAQDPDPNPAEDPGAQVLTRGPVHEAFAEPVVFDPKSGPVIPKQPPAPVEEAPPSEKPVGKNVQWIPGYWSWDDGRKDFLWVSGLWRDVPPGRHWVPGYWDQASGGFQWVPGYWAPDDQTQAQYLPAPPASLESGPSSPQPSPEMVWAPGNWSWQGGRYVWSPGYWVPIQSNWLWVPAHYVWTQSGYLFVPGYWDRPLPQRGVLFAPIYFQQPLYAQPGYVYSPTVTIVASALMASLFVAPAYHQYYFGDYYAPAYFRSGFYPWYAFHQSRYGYDPLYAHYAVVNMRTNPRWVEDMHDRYRFLRDHPDARPAHTFVEQQTTINRTVVINNTKVQNITFARPIREVAAGNNALKFERLDDQQRRAIAERAVQLHDYRQQRAARENQVVRDRREAVEARQVSLPRSPITAQPHPNVQGLNAQERARAVPPARPVMPGPDPRVRANPNATAGLRFEPHPDHLPPPASRPGASPPRAAAVERARERQEQGRGQPNRKPQ